MLVCGTLKPTLTSHCSSHAVPGPQRWPTKKGEDALNRRFAPLAALLVFGLLATACSSSPNKPSDSSQTAPPKTGGILRIAQTGADLQTLDPHYASGTQDRALVDMVYNGLVRFKPGAAPDLEPDLATDLPKPEMVGDKQVWTFTLKTGVKCHPTADTPAYELTSDDVLWSLTKSADKNRSAYAGAYSGMQFQAVDKTTVKVTLDKPQSPALFLPKFANYSGGFIICKQPGEKLGMEGLKTHPVGTGPFRFKQYLPKEKVVLEANTEYFRGKPLLDGIDYRYMATTSTRELALRDGQVDVAYGETDEIWVSKWKDNKNIKVDVFGPGELIFVQFNSKKTPLDKPEVRQAIAYALDRTEFQALYGPSVSEKVFAPVPQMVLGGMTEQELGAKNLTYPHNVQKAKELLAQAGFKDGFTLPDQVTSEVANYKKTYESLQAQLAKVGIKFGLKVVDHASYHSLIRKDTNDLIVYVAYRPDADAYLRQFFHSDSIVVTGPKPNTNFAHYDKVDALIDKAATEIDTAKQADAWKQAQIQILQDMGAYSITTNNQVYARSTAVDYGHEAKIVPNLYPGIDEKTRLTR